jgi:hypothetical protein
MKARRKASSVFRRVLVTLSMGKRGDEEVLVSTWLGEEVMKRVLSTHVMGENGRFSGSDTSSEDELWVSSHFYTQALFHHEI